MRRQPHNRPICDGDNGRGLGGKSTESKESVIARMKAWPDSSLQNFLATSRSRRWKRIVKDILASRSQK